MEKIDAFQNLLESMDYVSERLEALGILIERGVRDGSGMEHVSSGIELLISQECKTLSALRDAMYVEHNRRLENKLEVRDLDKIAMMCGIPKRTAADVVRVATGVILVRDSASPEAPR